MRRWIVRSLGGLTALIVLATLGVLAFIHTDTGRAVVRERVVDQLEDMFAGEVAIGRLEGSPFGTLVAHDVTITDAFGHPAIYIERIALDLELLSLLRKRLSMSTVTADGVVVDVHREPDGTISLAHLMRPGPKSEWMVIVDELALRGRVAIDLGGEPIHLDDLGVAGTLRASGDTLAASANVHGIWRERAAPLNAMVEVKRDGDTFEAPLLVVHAGAASVHVANVRFDGRTFAGIGVVRAPRAEVARLARVDSFGDVALAFRAESAVAHRDDHDGDDVAEIVGKPIEGPVQPSPDPDRSAERATHLELAGSLGEAGVRGELDVWLAARRIAGTLTGSNVDLALLSRERVPVRAGGTVVLDATLGDALLPTGQAMVSVSARATGPYDSLPPTQLSGTITSDGRRVRTRLEAHNPALAATATANLVIDEERVGLDAMRLSASSSDISRATGGLVPVHGSLELVANAHGAVLPEPALAVTGRFGGRELRAEDFEIDSLVVDLDARRLPERPLGRLELVARGIDRRGGQSFALRELKLTAVDRPDGAIEVSLRTRPKRDPWQLDADALVRLGETVTIELQRHVVRAGAGHEWRGRTGRLAIGPDRIVLRDFASASRDSTIALAGWLQRSGPRTGDLEAHAAVQRFTFAHLDPELDGRVDAHVDVQRRAGRLGGEASFVVTGFKPPVSPPSAPITPRPAEVPPPTTPKDPVAPLVTTNCWPGPMNGARSARPRPIAPAPTRAPDTSRAPVVPVIDARGTIRLDSRGLVADVAVDGHAAGEARLKLDLDAPADATDLRAWRRLERSAIRAARIDLARIELRSVLGALDGTVDARTARGFDTEEHEATATEGISERKRGHAGYAGVIDGQIRIDAGVPSGRIELRRLVAPQLRGLGAIDAELVIARAVSSGPAHDSDDASSLAFMPDRSRGVAVAVAARLDGLARIDGNAELRVPDRVFDAGAWRKLDRRVLRRATLSARDIAIDPGRLQRLGVVASVHGRISIDAEIVPDRATVTVAARELRGSPIAQPVSAELRATIDERHATAELAVTAPRDPVAGAGPAVRVLEAQGELPITLRQLLDDPSAVRSKPLSATLRVPQAPARTVLGLFGRTEITGGVLDGTVSLRGTVAAPTAIVKIVGTNIQVPPGPGGKPIRTVKQLVLDGTWRDRDGRLAIDAVQGDGRLEVRASGSPDRPRDVTVSVVARGFDLAPLLAFAPGPAGGAAGRLDANVTVRGADPRTAQIAGEVHLRGARVPLAPSVGTLRRASIDLVVRGTQLQVAVDGRLGGGSVKANGAVSLVGVSPTGGDLKMTLRDVRPIGVVEPAVDADVTVAMRREQQRWLADIAVRNGSVKIPSSRGEPLAPVGAPTDMVFVTGERLTPRPMAKRPPEDPMLVANISIGPTRIESEELRGIVRGKLTVTADTSSVGIVGVIEADRGELALFGRRYKTERAVVRFDGTLDPLLDISLVHEFPEVVTTTEVRGRMSNPKLTLRASPSTYSQAQLLGFLLGGEPSGAPSDAGDRATAAGASFLANRIGGYVRRSLPIDLDVLRYEHETATTSAAITVGTWLSSDLFLAYRRRLEARPDENSGEGELEYWLFRRVVIEAVIGDRGRNAIDLLWRKRY